MCWRWGCMLRYEFLETFKQPTNEYKSERFVTDQNKGYSPSCTLCRNIGVCWNPPIFNLGIIRLSRQFHVLAVLVQEVEPQYLLRRRLGESPDSVRIFRRRANLLLLPRSEPRFSGRIPSSLFVVPPTLTLHQFRNYFATTRATSSILNTCKTSNLRRIFKLWQNSKYSGPLTYDLNSFPGAGRKSRLFFP
jgi:hypothetical protein